MQRIIIPILIAVTVVATASLPRTAIQKAVASDEADTDTSANSNTTADTDAARARDATLSCGTSSRATRPPVEHQPGILVGDPFEGLISITVTIPISHGCAAVMAVGLPGGSIDPRKLRRIHNCWVELNAAMRVVIGAPRPPAPKSTTPRLLATPTTPNDVAPPTLAITSNLLPLP